MRTKSMTLAMVLSAVLVLLSISTWTTIAGSEETPAPEPTLAREPVPIAPTSDRMRPEHATILYGAGQYLVVWVEQDVDDYMSKAICAARLSGNLQNLDPQGIVIARRRGHVSWPQVAFDGDNFLVVWSQEPLGGYVDEPSEIMAARVTAAGKVVDPEGISVNNEATKKGLGGVSFAGGVFMVAWMEDQHAIKAARMHSDGRVLDPQGITIREYEKGSRYVNDYLMRAQLVAVNDRFLMVWHRLIISAEQEETRELFARRLDTAGKVLDEKDIVLSTDQPDNYSLQVIPDGKRALVWWRKGENPSADAYATFVTAEGAVTHPGGVPIGRGLPELQIVYNGREYYLFWAVVERRVRESEESGSISPSYWSPPEIVAFHGFRAARLSLDRQIGLLDGVLLENPELYFEPTYARWASDGEGSCLFTYVGAPRPPSSHGRILVKRFDLTAAQ